jgi:chromosome segregation ATPase
MKKVVILLGVLCIALVALLWGKQRSAGAQLRRAADEVSTLTNQLATTEIKLNHQERLNASLGGQLTNNAAALAKSAEQMAAVRATLAQTKAESRHLREQLQAAQTGRGATEARAIDLMNELEKLRAALRDKDSQLAAAQERTTKAEVARQASAQELVQARLENDALIRKWRNPALLRSQLDAMEKRVATAKRAPSDAPSLDMRLNVELQPDGSVRLQPPPTTEELRELEQALQEKLAAGR